MPIDASGTAYATQVCETSLQYNASDTTQLATTTTYCYKQNDIYYQQTIDLVIVILVFFGVVMLIKSMKGKG